jgi:glycosyltransferase-like protein
MGGAVSGVRTGCAASRASPVTVSLLTYSTKPRGGVVHTLALAEALASLGCAVEVWTLGRGGDPGFFRPVADSVRVRMVAFADRDGEGVGARITRSIDELAAALRADGLAADVVHAQDCLSANAALRVRPDVLRTVHHLDQFSTPELVACHERALREPRGHVCVSEAVAAELADGWGIRATVIPNGVAAERFAAAAADDPASVRARSAWHARLGRYVLAVGGIEPRKGTADLVEAMALLRATEPGVALALAGGDTLFDYRGYRDEVLARAAELRVEPVLLGPVPDDELPSLVAGSAVFALPSTKEGFGLAAMEALAARVPLVLRDLPVLREVFDGAARFAAVPAAGVFSATRSGAAGAGFPAALAEALAEALGPRDPGLTARGCELAASYTWDAAARAHLRLYSAHLGAR